METTDTINPIEAITAEIEKAMRAPDKLGLLSVRSANAWIEESKNTPMPKKYCHGLIVEGENTVLFARSNVGKSLFATQLAEEIAREEKVLFIDCELSSKQFEMRYTDEETKEMHVFPANFLRAEIDPGSLEGVDMSEAVLQSIEIAAQRGIRKVFIDNLTFICRDAEKAVTAAELMIRLVRLKKMYDLTMVVVAHTPKRDSGLPLTQNDLAGSSKLMNFFDSGIVIGLSSRDKNLRYVKQVKYRAGEKEYDYDNVILYEIVKEHAYTHFAFRGHGVEADHIKAPSFAEDLDEIQQILELQANGKSVREMASLLDITSSKVQRRLKKAGKLGITAESFKTSTVSPVSPVSHPIQPTHPDTPKLF